MLNRQEGQGPSACKILLLPEKNLIVLPLLTTVPLTALSKKNYIV